MAAEKGGRPITAQRLAAEGLRKLGDVPRLEKRPPLGIRVDLVKQSLLVSDREPLMSAYPRRVMNKQNLIVEGRFGHFECVCNAS